MVFIALNAVHWLYSLHKNMMKKKQSWQTIQVYDKEFFLFSPEVWKKKKSFHELIKEKYPQQIAADNLKKIIYLQMRRSQNICKFFLLLLYFFQILIFFATFIDFKVSFSNTKSIEGLDFTEKNKKTLVTGIF